MMIMIDIIKHMLYESFVSNMLNALVFILTVRNILHVYVHRPLYYLCK